MGADKLNGLTLYTEGANNALTLGNQTSTVVGANNQISIGGQTNITAPLDATFAAGVYFEGIAGANITWTNGPTLGMTEGDSVNINTTSRQQATDWIEIAAGVSSSDQPIQKLINRTMTGIKALLVTQMAVNIGIGSAGDIANDANNAGSPTNILAGSIGTAAAVGVANFALAGTLIGLIKSLAVYANQLQHVSNIKLASDHIELDGEFTTTTSRTYFDTNSASMSRSARDNSLSTSLRMDNTNTTLRYEKVEAVSTLNLGDSTALLSVSKAQNGSTLELKTNKAQLSFPDLTNPSSATLSADSLALKVGGATPSSVTLKNGSVSLGVGTVSVNLTQDSFKVYSPAAGGLDFNGKTGVNLSTNGGLPIQIG